MAASTSGVKDKIIQNLEEVNLQVTVLHDKLLDLYQEKKLENVLHETKELIADHISVGRMARKRKSSEALTRIHLGLETMDKQKSPDGAKRLRLEKLQVNIFEETDEHMTSTFEVLNATKYILPRTNLGILERGKTIQHQFESIVTALQPPKEGEKLSADDPPVLFRNLIRDLQMVKKELAILKAKAVSNLETIQDLVEDGTRIVDYYFKTVKQLDVTGENQSMKDLVSLNVKYEGLLNAIIETVDVCSSPIAEIIKVLQDNLQLLPRSPTLPLSLQVDLEAWNIDK